MTDERILNNSMAEWLFVRLKTSLEFEGRDVPGVRAYYAQLQARDNQRAVRAYEAGGASDGEESFLPRWAKGLAGRQIERERSSLRP